MSAPENLKCPVCQREVDLDAGKNMAAKKQKHKFPGLWLDGFCSRCGIVSSFPKLKVWLNLYKEDPVTSGLKRPGNVPVMSRTELADNLHAYLPQRELEKMKGESAPAEFGENPMGLEISDPSSGLSIKVSMSKGNISTDEDGIQTTGGLISRAWTRIKEFNNERPIPMLTRPIKRPPAPAVGKRFKIDHKKLKKSGS